MARLDSLVPGDAPCYAVRIDGRFERVRARSVPRQRHPYPPLSEVVPHQVEFDLHDLEGSMVGFRFADYAQGLNVPGYHLHVISADRTRGGHVLDSRTAWAEVRIDRSSDLHVELPAGVEWSQPDSWEGDRGRDPMDRGQLNGMVSPQRLTASILCNGVNSSSCLSAARTVFS